MASNTAIEWTDHTTNFWWGCTKVGPGCDHCYAETLSDRFHKPSLWGAGAPRKKMRNAERDHLRLKSGWVFVQSMADIGDNEVPLEWLEEAWAAIKANTNVRPQILTKRLPMLLKRLEEIGETEWPQHAGLMITAVNQAEIDRDEIRLVNAKYDWNIPWVGVSAEPMLGPMRFDHLWPIGDEDGFIDTPALDWVVCGGESGPGARPMDPDWARDLRDQCADGGVPFFMKQMGGPIKANMPPIPADLDVKEWPKHFEGPQP